MNRLRELRVSSNLTLQELAKIMNMSYSNIAMMERGERSLTQENVELFCSFFKVSSDYLLGLDSQKSRKDLPEFAFALYGEVKDLTEEQQEEILRLVKTHKEFLKK